MIRGTDGWDSEPSRSGEHGTEDDGDARLGETVLELGDFGEEGEEVAGRARRVEERGGKNNETGQRVVQDLGEGIERRTSNLHQKREVSRRHQPQQDLSSGDPRRLRDHHLLLIRFDAKREESLPN